MAVDATVNLESMGCLASRHGFRLIHALVRSRRVLLRVARGKTYVRRHFSVFGRSEQLRKKIALTSEIPKSYIAMS